MKYIVIKMNIPENGFGTYKLSKPDAYSMVTKALDYGYRLIDTAERYCNEAAVAKAIEDSKVLRKDIFLCTKASTGYHGNIEKSVRKRLRIFGSIDLLLLHWVSSDAVAGWNVLCKLQREQPDKIKNIGICNISEDTLRLIMDKCDKKPDAIQNELNPYCYDAPLYKYCLEQGIKVISHSCMVFGEALEYDEIIALARKHGCTPAQMLVRWAQEHADIVLTRCDNEEYMKVNYGVDMDYIPIDTDREVRKYGIG